MADIDALKAAYEAEIAKISDSWPLRAPKATYVLERWEDASTALAALEANNISSYTLAGRTFTRSDLKDLAQQVADLTARLDALIYGRTSLVDMNRNVAQP